MALAALVVAGTACGGGRDGDGSATPAPSAASTPTTVTATTAARPTRPPEPAGVETFQVNVGHVAPDVTVPYAQTPPVGGVHHPGWQPCGFYDGPVPNETAVHSLEHGAIWITYRPDLPAADIETLRRMATPGGTVLVSRWDEGLPSPLVASSWGRQLKLESASDPRLAQFMAAFRGDAPEPFASCA